MAMSRLRLRFGNRYREARSLFSYRRLRTINHPLPLISFTFDDVPRSACTRGRTILEGAGVRGTFYLSLGLMDGVYSIGTAFSRDDLGRLIDGGHEIGSHTFDHLDSWATPADVFEESLIQNRTRLRELQPGHDFRTMSYPLSTPHPRIKKRSGELHLCCRGGGQTHNARRVDLNLLKSYFIDARNRNDLDALKKAVDASCRESGWLIFSTHDIDEHPSPYGCSPRVFEDLVRYACGTGAEILPVDEACARLDPAPVRPAAA